MRCPRSVMDAYRVSQNSLIFCLEWYFVNALDSASFHPTQAKTSSASAGDGLDARTKALAERAGDSGEKSGPKKLRLRGKT